MDDKAFHFRADVRCHMEDGSVVVIPSFPIRVPLATRQDAIDNVKFMLERVIADGGYWFLPAALDEVEILSLWEAIK